MDLRAALGLKKKKRKKVSTRQKTTVKKEIPVKPATIEPAEDPIISFSRQMTIVQTSINKLEAGMRSGFESLRDDHHRILEDQASKLDLDSFKKELLTKKAILERTKEELESEIDVLDVDRNILEHLEGKKLRAIALADKLRITRQYAATRLNKLQDLGYVKSSKQGRKIFYEVK